MELRDLSGLKCLIHNAPIIVGRSGEKAFCKNDGERCDTAALLKLAASLNGHVVNEKAPPGGGPDGAADAGTGDADNANGHDPAQEHSVEYLVEIWKAALWDGAKHACDELFATSNREVLLSSPLELWIGMVNEHRNQDKDPFTKDPPLTPIELDEEIEKVARRLQKHYADGAEAGAGQKAEAGAQTEEWPDPKSIETELLPVPPFNALLLPKALRPWLSDIAERAQCPLDFLAAGATVTLASQIARHVAIRPKRHDDWTVIPNVWGGIIAPPGYLKSPMLAETVSPLRRLAHEAALRFDEESRLYEAESIVRKAQLDVVEQAIRGAIKKDRSANLDDLRSELAALTSEPPHEARSLVNDVTVEKLGEILNRNPGGVLIFRDELSGFLRSLERQGHEADRAFYCESWNGSGRFTYDRIGRGTIHIARACVSILGGIQPGPWRRYMREAFQEGQDDGFVSRFQLLVWPDVSHDWKNVDRWPEAAAKKTAWGIFSALEKLKPGALGAEQPEGCEVPFLRFAPDAQELFNEWRGDLETKLRREDEHPILVSHLAKYRKLMPALALVFHTIACVEGSVGSGGGVSLGAATQAAAWCDFLEAHARRCYQSVTDATNTAASALALKVRGGKITNPFRARDIYRSGWEGLSEREDAYRAIDALEEAGWVRRQELTPENGRRSVQFWINPKLSGAPR